MSFMSRRHGSTGSEPRGTSYVIDAIPGLTYRQLDNWIRQGWIVSGMPGSGNYRTFTDAEVAGIREVALALDEIDRQAAEIRSGRVFRRTVRAAEADL